MNLAFKKSDLLEYYVMALLFFGLPLVAFVYFGWRAALTTFVVTQVLIGLLALRGTQEGVNEEQKVETE